MTATTTEPQAPPTAAEELMGRMFGEANGAFHQLSAYLGVKLGLFRALADDGPLTAAGLAAATGLDERYVEEWLQAEAIAGLVALDGDDVATGQFSLVEGGRDVLVDDTSPFHLTGLATALVTAGRVMPELVEAFRTGAGVPYEAYPEGACAQASLTRPAYANLLVDQWLPAIPDVLARLADESRPARVLDVGCGHGWAAIELARAFPHARIEGIDSDEESVALARKHAAEEGVADRVRFEQVDATALDGRYDVVLLFECLHDMGRPVEVLEAVRRSLAPGGTIVVVDERVGETLTTPGDPIESFFAACSVIWCLPQSRVVPDCEAPGTVMRPATLRRFAERAGYSGVEELPVDYPFWRFYRLVP